MTGEVTETKCDEWRCVTADLEIFSTFGIYSNKR